MQSLEEHLDCGQQLHINRELVKARVNALLDVIRTKQSRTAAVHDCDGGPYVGISGIAFMYWYLSQQSDLYTSEECDHFRNEALLYIRPAIEYAENIDKSSCEKVAKVAYLLGNAGTYLVAALVYNAIGDAANRTKFVEKYASLAAICRMQQYLSKGSDELLVGRAGYICGALYLNKALHMQIIPNEVLENLAIATIESGRQYATSRRIHYCPLMYSYYDTEYIGAAHGVAGIIQVLLQIPNFARLTPEIERDIKTTIDFLLSLQTPSGNFPCAMDELGDRARPEEDELVHWCHGAPGVVWLMAKAYLVWKEEKYLNSCVRCADLIWKRGLLRKGPGICHGVAGNAYVFLLLYRLTKDIKYLYRANKFQEFIFTKEFKKGSRIPDSPYSLFEGFAGTVCFMTDLLQPEKAQFPLYTDVFD
ncbi:lanC-like protein 3 [Dinothrombium tinctorium]|uniref:LanC-like protein 3 homolog n=1 Tax=Dinothrombium tinctorium TaxID=1965070 RepID=A0A3S3NZQ3_9ACAR|nr:lanC-like protein 3 [Dinothrombium tinctorium]RWS12318.1 lanC-like protein 3 [Dinothrombium tinctorium]